VKTVQKARRPTNTYTKVPDKRDDDYNSDDIPEDDQYEDSFDKMENEIKGKKKPLQ